MGKIQPPAGWSSRLPGCSLLSLGTQFHTSYYLVKPGSFVTLSTNQIQFTEAQSTAGLQRGLDICGT